MEEAKELIKLTSDEAKYIEDLVIENDLLLRNVLKVHLGKLYESLGDECLSEAHLLACRKIAILKEHKNPAGWLVNVVKYKAYDALRELSEKHYAPLDDELTSENDDPCYNEALYNMWIEENAIDSALSILTKTEMDVYKELFIEMRDEADVAKSMGITKKSINNLKNKIVHKIDDYIYNKL